FVLGNGANLRDVSLELRGNESTIATHPALQVDKVVGVANAPDTRLHLGTLLSEPLVLTTGRCERVLGLLQAHGFLWGTARPVRCGRLICALRVALYSYKLLPSFGQGLVGRAFFGGHRTADRFDQLVLHMEQVG